MPWIPNTQIAAAGSGDGVPQYELSVSASVGATSITVTPTPATPLAVSYYILIDAWTSQAEIRKVAAVAGALVSFSGGLDYAHASGDQILVIDTGVLTTAHWGCKADNSTDDHTALQEAVYQCAVNGTGMWLDGQNKQWHRITQPLMVGSGTKLRQCTINAAATFAPAESNNAMVMSWNGNVRTFTADPATDIITCSSAHGAPGDNQGVVLQATTMPGGLTAGKFYYIRDRSGADFKVSDTSGGAAVDITSAGSGGRAFFEVYAANAKTTFDDVYINNGGLVSGLNGLLMSVQQQGQAIKLRIDNMDGFGLKLKGQQYVMYNFEAIGCEIGLVLDDMSFLYCFGFNIERALNGIVVETASESCLFSGMHFEMNAGSGYSTAASIAVFLDAGSQNFTIENVSNSMGTSGQTFLKVDTGGAGSSSYSIRNARWSGGISSAGQLFVNDVDRGVDLDQFTDCAHILQFVEAPVLSSSQSFDDPAPMVIIGAADRRIYLGASNNDQAQLRIRPGNAQTGSQFQADDASGIRVSGFNKDGVFFTERNSAPADGDLVAGEMTFWFDDTNGAAKLMIKAKQADGTVRTGNVALA